MPATCETCKFFSPATGRQKTGYCRRFPPQVFFSEQQDVEYSAFPEVGKDAWCGEHDIGPKSEEK